MKKSNFSNFITPLLAFSMLIGITIFSGSCRNEQGQQDERIEAETNIDTVVDPEPRAYRGEISTLNQEFNDGNEVNGRVAIRIARGIMRVNVYAQGLEPDMRHMQHLQASEETTTDCPGSNADENNDGVIDVMEITDEPEGVVLIPLNMGPSSLEVDVLTYPMANDNGEIQFEAHLHIDSLRTAVQEQYGIENIDFTRFTYVLQGVSPETSIPASTATIGDIPPYATVPVGCAVLEEVEVEAEEE